MKIPALQAVTVEILVDNFFDVFEPSRPGIVERVIPGRLKKPLVAAHGLAYLITLNQQGKLTRILMDAANAPLPLFNNLEALEHKVDEIDAVVLSHGHPDHYGGLLGFLAKRTGGPIPVYLHKDVFLPKVLDNPPGPHRSLDPGLGTSWWRRTLISMRTWGRNWSWTRSCSPARWRPPPPMKSRCPASGARWRTRTNRTSSRTSRPWWPWWKAGAWW